MNREVEKLLPNALAAVRDHLLKDKDNEIVFKEYDGYAANLGAAIRMSGLLPALSFFTDVHNMKSDGKPYRNRLLVAVLAVLEKDIPEAKETSKSARAKQGRELLLKVVADKDNSKKFHAWKHQITLASVALKLALRAFIHTDKEFAEN